MSPEKSSAPCPRRRLRLVHLLTWLTALTLMPTGAALAEDDLGEAVQLSLERYARLLAVAQRQGAPRAAWGAGQVTVTLPSAGEAHARVTANAQLSLVGGEGEAVVPLLPAEVTLISATADGREAAMRVVGGAHVALFDQNTRSARIALTWLVPVSPGADGPSAVIPLPPLPGAGLTINGPGAGQAEAWPAASVSRSGSQMTARLKATSAVAVRWGGARAGHDVRQVRYQMTPDAAGEGMDVVTSLAVDVSGQRARVRLAPATEALVALKVNGKPAASRVVDGWHTAPVTGPGLRTIEATMRLKVDRGQGQPMVSLGLDQVPITEVEVSVPGKRKVEFTPEVPVRTRFTGPERAPTTVATAHLPPSQSMQVRWTESRAAPESTVRVNTETWQLLTLKEGVLQSRVVLDYEVIRGKLKEIPIEIPEGVVVYKVEGPNIEDWLPFSRTDDAPRQVRITLLKELEGKTRFELVLEQKVPLDEGAPLKLPLVKPLRVFRQMGVVALFDGDKVGFGDATANDFTRVGQDALPASVRQTLTEKVSQAYKHIGVPQGIDSSVATARAREVRFDARVGALYTIKEGALATEASVRISIKSGRRDALVFSVPEGVTEPQVNAPSLNKVEQKKDFDAGQGRKAYEIRFTQALEGALDINIEFEQLLPKELGRVQVPDIRVHGAEVEGGHLGLTAETAMEVEPAEVKDLRRVDIASLPRVVRDRTDRDLRLAYEYALGPWALNLDVKRNKTVQTIEAVITRARVSTWVLDSGYLVSRATFEVANQDRQALRIGLPDGAKVLGVASDGRQVKAITDEQGAIAVALPRPETAEEDTRISLVDVAWEIRRDPLGLFNSVDLLTPDVDLRMSDLQWQVHVPYDLSVVGTDTPMARAGAGNWDALISETDALASLALPLEVPHRTLLFTYAVHDAAEPALDLSLTLSQTLGAGVGDLLALLGLLALGLVVRWRARGESVAGGRLVLAVAGAGCLVLKTVGWGLDFPEALFAISILVGVAFFSRRKRRAETAEVIS